MLSKLAGWWEKQQELGATKGIMVGFVLIALFSFLFLAISALRSIDSFQRLSARDTKVKAPDSTDQGLVLNQFRPEELEAFPQPSQPKMTEYHPYAESASMPPKPRDMKHLGVHSGDASLAKWESRRRKKPQGRVEQTENLRAAIEADWKTWKNTAKLEIRAPVALTAFQKLRELNDDESAQILLTRVRSEPQSEQGEIIRSHALASLAGMTTGRALTGLHELLLSQDRRLQRETVKCIGTYGNKAMVPLLEKMRAYEPYGDLGGVTTEAIVKIRSRSHPPDLGGQASGHTLKAFER